jgi:hypothetical protein
MPFDHWNSKRSAASDADAQRALVSEIGSWRARNLTDIPGQRDAAFALAKLHKTLGNTDDAVREARTLMSLCQTPPEASKAELAVARKTLTGLGASAPRVASAAPARERRERKPDRNDRSAGSAPDAVVERALAGDFSGARRIAKGQKSRQALRVWVDVQEILASDADQREALLRRLEGRLRQTLGLAVPKGSKAEQPPAPPVPEDGALGQLLGRRLPRRREPFLRAMEAWLDEHPDQVDVLASTALQHHIDGTGADHPAPWLATFVARALIADGAATRAVIQSHAEAPIGATFLEPAFERSLSLVASPRFSGLRRSVLGRNAEPDDRRAWTVRFDDQAKMLVVVPEHTEPYPTDIAEQLAARLPALCSRVVVLAPGPANGPLREVLAGAGLVSLDGRPSDSELLAALDHVTPMERPERPKRESPKKKEARKDDAKQAPRAQDAAPSPAPAKAEAPKVDPMDAVRDVLADPSADVPRIRAALEPLPKLRDAFLHASATWFPLADDASVRTAALLDAADAEAPDGLRVPEATTLALRVAAAQAGPTLDRLSAGSTAERFSGPGIADVVGVVRGAQDAGWTLRRAFRGTTRRERRNQPMLSELAGALDGVWRLGVERDGVRAELWYVADLPIEGRAAIPQLLLEERQRVVVLPVDPDLMSWYATLDAPAAIGWTGEEAADVGAALSALTT